MWSGCVIPTPGRKSPLAVVELIFTHQTICKVVERMNARRMTLFSSDLVEYFKSYGVRRAGTLKMSLSVAVFRLDGVVRVFNSHSRQKIDPSGRRIDFQYPYNFAKL